MASVKIDPIKKLKAQVADQKEVIKDLKASIRDFKQQLKAQKASLQSAWQLEIEAHAEHALSVGYELGYLEAIAGQKDVMRQLRHDCETLQASLQVDTSVDYSGLEGVLSSAVGQHRMVPMPAPIPAVLVQPVATTSEVLEIIEAPVIEAAEPEAVINPPLNIDAEIEAFELVEESVV